MNSDTRYGAVHKTLHWVIALCVLMMLIMGIVMDDIPNGPDKFWVYGIHKSLGITILALMLARLGWKLANWHRPKPLPNHALWERMLAGTVHWSLYALLIAMPLSGWLGTGAANSTINWFGFFVVPNIMGPDQDLKDVLFEAHEIMALGIWGLLALHIAGAVKHAVIDRDKTLNRMVPFAAFLLVMAPGVVFGADTPTAWTIDRAQSKLMFTATQEGAAFNGEFGAFDGEIVFDEAAPETGRAKITIDLNSFKSGNPERDNTVKDEAWFDITSNPTATYSIDGFEKGTEKGAYIARGRLFLRGIERPVDMPFTLDITRDGDTRTAHAQGKTSLKRLAFDVGNGDWKDTAMVGDDVTITLDLFATAKDK